MDHDLQKQTQWAPATGDDKTRTKLYKLKGNMLLVYRHALSELGDLDKAAIERVRPDVSVDSTAFRLHGEEMKSIATKWGKALMKTVNTYKTKLDDMEDNANVLQGKKKKRRTEEAKPTVSGVAGILVRAVNADLVMG